jgi:hypothetical protein
MSAVDDSTERGREFADAQLFPPQARQALSVKHLLQTARSAHTAVAATATIAAMASPVVDVAVPVVVAVAEAQLFSDDNDENMPCASISTTADTEAIVCCERVAPMSSITRPRLDNDASLYMILKDTASFDEPPPPTQQCTPIATVAAIGLDNQQCGALSLQGQQQQPQHRQQQSFWPIMLGRQFVGSIASLLSTQSAQSNM